MSNYPYGLKTNVVPSLTRRMRRLRGSEAIRSLVRENAIDMGDLVHPLFIRAGQDQKIAISTMPGHFQWTLDHLKKELKVLEAMGIKQLLLFGIPAEKDGIGSGGFAKDGIIQQATRLIKDTLPDSLVITDVCCCEYTDHGQCGALDCRSPHHHVDNDATLEIIAAQAISHAQAGADIVAPSGMMDGQIAAIRAGLDSEGFHNTPIFSYAVKYASALYGPFRAAAEGAPKVGDRKNYQMDPANGNEALLEALLDVEEGADMLMVKPASVYMDVIYRVKEQFPALPLGAYHVSGEFAMIKAAAERGWIDEQKVVMEVLTGLKRAGADILINYFSKELSGWLHP